MGGGNGLAACSPTGVHIMLAAGASRLPVTCSKCHWPWLTFFFLPFHLATCQKEKAENCFVCQGKHHSLVQKHMLDMQEVPNICNEKVFAWKRVRETNLSYSGDPVPVSAANTDLDG